MIASLRSDFSAPETSTVHGCAPLNIAMPEAVGADGCLEKVCPAEGTDADDEDAVPLGGESESPVTMIVATTATMTTRTAAAETKRMFLRCPEESSGVSGGRGSAGVRYCVGAACIAPPG